MLTCGIFSGAKGLQSSTVEDIPIGKHKALIIHGRRSGTQLKPICKTTTGLQRTKSEPFARRQETQEQKHGSDYNMAWIKEWVSMTNQNLTKVCDSSSTFSLTHVTE